MQARRECSEIFKVLREKLTNLKFCIMGNNSSKKTFSDKQKLREFVASRPPLQKNVKKELL